MWARAQNEEALIISWLAYHATDRKETKLFAALTDASYFSFSPHKFQSRCRILYNMTELLFARINRIGATETDAMSLLIARLVQLVRR